MKKLRIARVQSQEKHLYLSGKIGNPTMPISQHDALPRAISGNPGKSGWVRCQPMAPATRLKTVLAINDKCTCIVERVTQVSPLTEKRYIL